MGIWYHIRLISNLGDTTRCSPFSAVDTELRCADDQQINLDCFKHWSLTTFLGHNWYCFSLIVKRWTNVTKVWFSLTTVILTSPNPRNRNSISMTMSKLLSVASMNTLFAIVKVTDARHDVILVRGLNHRFPRRHLPPSPGTKTLPLFTIIYYSSVTPFFYFSIQWFYLQWF